MEDESYVSFNCPNCGNSVEYLEQYAGTAQVCPFCNEDVIVPQSGEQEGTALPLPIETSRLVVRKLRAEDIDDLIELLTDEKIFEFDERPPLSHEEVKVLLDKAAEQRLSDTSGELRLGIELKTNNKIIGNVRFKYQDTNRQQARLTIGINSSFQRQGFAYETLQAMLKFGFCDIGLHRLTVMCDSRNVAAVRLLTKLGMRKEAECLRDRFVNEEWSDSLWFAMLEEEFPCG